MRRNPNKRSDDLRAALQGNGHKANGNHRIEVHNGLARPSIELCKPCELSLRCLSGKQVTDSQAYAEKRPCCRRQSLVRFYYHGTCCLTFDRNVRQVTDHNKYGYSVTTSGNIRKYLNALWDCEDDLGVGPLDLSYSRIDEIIKAFKSYRPKNDGDELWLPV